MISSIFLIAVGLPNLIYAQKNIVDLATELGATELVSFIKAAGLDEALSGTGPFTVFAPTNDAFTALPSDVVEKLKSDKQLLSDTLKYHVHNGRVYSSELKNDLTASTLDDLNEIRINLYGKVATVNGAKIDKVNQNATNGVIHVIEKVLYPVPTLNLVQLIGTTKDFSTLLYCIIRANIEGQLAGGPFTVFVPTDEAFKKLPVGALSDLLSNQTALIDVLTYHVINGTVYSAGITDGAKIEALNKKELTFKVTNDGVTVQSSKVTTADVGVTNGVVHVIDTVLLPGR